MRHRYIWFFVLLFVTPIQSQRIKRWDTREPVRKYNGRIQRMGVAITTKFTGGTSGDAAVFSNWSNGLARGTSDKIVIPSTTTQAITSNLGSIPAEDTLTLTAEPALNETLVIDSTTYKFVDTLAAAFDVFRTGTANTTLGNLIKAINLTGVAGTDYDSATMKHGTVYATDEAGDTMDAIARTAGTAGNSIVTTEGGSRT